MNTDRIHPYVNNVDVSGLLAAAAEAQIPGELQRHAHPWIATVGRLHVEKKSQSTIELQSRLAERGMQATGVLVGGGAYRETLEHQSVDLGVQDRVLFLGQLPQPQGMAIAAAADFYFAPMQGNALIEAMAADVASSLMTIPSIGSTSTSAPLGWCRRGTSTPRRRRSSN